MIDQARIRRAFARAAAHFDAQDFLHREVLERLLERLLAVTVEPDRIIDLGAGTGNATPDIQNRFPTAQILSVDSSAQMLAAGKPAPSRLCAEAAKLPLIDACSDLVISNLMLHHCPDPAVVLTEARRVLSDQGALMLTTFGRNSFIELGRAWASADPFTHIAPFFDIQDLGNLLTTSGFTEPVLDIQTLTITYDNLTRMMQDLRSAGSTNSTNDRNRGLTGRGAWQRLTDAYDQLRGADGKLPVSIEIIFVLAWAGKHNTAGGEVEIPIDTISRVFRKPPH
jgi:malonyl-CoA O-methyltransferase